MGGIAGWVDFDRDLVLDRAAVLLQLAAVAARGPDGEGLWAAPHAVIGHRRKATVDLKGGHQPVTAVEDGTVVAVLALDGEVYNFVALRDELRRRGHRFHHRSDSEVLLRAYLEWGEQCAERLEGIFAFAIWDARDERLLLGRDRLGVKPLFYLPLGAGVLFGSEPKAVLAHPLAEPVVDADGLRELLAFTSTPGRGVFTGLRRVCPGEVVRVDRRGLVGTRYWELVAAPHQDDRETTISVVRALLDQAVTAQLDADVPVGVLLSGGLDSSSVAALAAGALRRRGEGPVRTFTAGYRGAETARSGPMRGSLDPPYAKLVAEHIGALHQHIELDVTEAVDAMMRRTAVRAQQDMVVAAPRFPTSLRLLCRRIGQDIGVALAGEQADTVFGSFMGADDPAVVHAETYPWIAATAPRLPPHGLGTGLLDPGLLDKLDVPSYCADTYLDDLARVPRLPGEDPHEQRMRELYFLHLQGWQEFGCALDDGVSATSGVELRWPFCDHHLVEYLFNVPWSLKTFDGKPKSLLRAAVADLLPASVCNRAPSQFPTGGDPAYPAFLRQQLTAVLSDRAAPVLPLLDVAAAEQLVRSRVDPKRIWRDVTDIEMILQLNQWLEQFRVRLVL